LGIAFQLKDDLLGSFGDSSVTGKSNDTDLKEGKRTYIIEQFDKLADDDTRRQFYSLFGRQEINEEQTSELRDLLKSSGAVTHTEQAIERFAKKSHSALDELALTEPYSS